MRRRPDRGQERRVVDVTRCCCCREFNAASHGSILPERQRKHVDNEIIIASSVAGMDVIEQFRVYLFLYLRSTKFF